MDRAWLTLDLPKVVIAPPTESNRFSTPINSPSMLFDVYPSISTKKAHDQTTNRQTRIVQEILNELKFNIMLQVCTTTVAAVCQPSAPADAGLCLHVRHSYCKSFNLLPTQSPQTRMVLSLKVTRSEEPGGIYSFTVGRL